MKQTANEALNLMTSSSPYSMQLPMTEQDTLPLAEAPLEEVAKHIGQKTLTFAVEAGEATKPEIFTTVQGEGRNLGRPVVFARLSGCNLQCSWSPEEHQRVLLPDWSEKMLKDIQIGDKILGVATEINSGKHNTLEVATVTNKISEAVSTLYKIKTDRGEVILDEHDQLWLTGNRGKTHSGWRNVLKTKAGQNIRQLFGNDNLNREEFEKGWLAGSIDGDGTRWWNGNSMRFRFAVSEPEYVDEVYRLLVKYGAVVKIGVHYTTGFSKKPREYKCVTGRNDTLSLAINVKEITDSYRRGWLAGMYDAEGSRGVNSNIQISQSLEANPDKWQIIHDYLTALGYSFGSSNKGFRMRGGLPEVYRFYKQCTPFLQRKKDSILGQSVRGIGIIRSVEKIGGGTIIHLTTSTSNLVVNGFLLHNCDTPYTWAFTDKLAEKHDQGKVYDRKEEQIKLTVGEAVDKVSGYPLDRLVITGGEPMQQQKNLVPFLQQLRERNPNQWVEIETNGTIAPNTDMLELVDQFNVSPKLENSGNELKRRQKDKAMETLVATPKADFKYVVFGDEDLPEILGLVEKYKIPHERVFLMPEGRTEEEVEKHQRELFDTCLENNFNMTTRLHVLLFGAKRGV